MIENSNFFLFFLAEIIQVIYINVILLFAIVFSTVAKPTVKIAFKSLNSKSKILLIYYETFLKDSNTKHYLLINKLSIKI